MKGQGSGRARRRKVQGRKEKGRGRKGQGSGRARKRKVQRKKGYRDTE